MKKVNKDIKYKRTNLKRFITIGLCTVISGAGIIHTTETFAESAPTNGEFATYHLLEKIETIDTIEQPNIADNGQYATAKWVGDYYLKQDGKLALNQWIEDHGNWYYLKSDGKFAHDEWIADYYLNTDGRLASNQWIEMDNTWYYIKEDGRLASNQWVKQDGHWYYINEKGTYEANQWMGDYYLTSTGALALNQWIQDPNTNEWYYIGSDGLIARNTTIDGYQLADDGTIMPDLSVLENKVNQTVYNGQCYGLTAFYVDSLHGPKLMGSGHMRAETIGSDYDWASYGFEVINNPTYDQIKAGDIIQWKANTRLAPGYYGHTGIIRGKSNGQLLTYEQNAGRGQICYKYTRDFIQQDVKSIVRKIM
ncbi:Putative cell wall binding repeat-containing protein [Granulicatella balaenopterae]|uniref:Putative cell wall binding repeat-containing protein n=1 Tax=Granulicatella balaenopterae TaxID=137733 RepID=A0A1H9IWT8_9LACT|nr:CHAP domain-containing protein [Granulicatella balaenopterae]SEQ79261.1 Putative cell wall binding repeat-containing protein [Granulicatella balaenopterae]